MYDARTHNTISTCTLIVASVVPHVTEAIQNWVETVAARPGPDGERADVCIIEVRTVGRGKKRRAEKRAVGIRKKSSRCDMSQVFVGSPYSHGFVSVSC